jgi:hypothetical protein
VSAAPRVERIGFLDNVNWWITSVYSFNRSLRPIPWVVKGVLYAVCGASVLSLYEWGIYGAAVTIAVCLSDAEVNVVCGLGDEGVRD